MQKKLLLIMAVILIAIGNVMGQNYLTFTCQQDGSGLEITHTGGNSPDIKYSLNGGAWTDITTTLTLKEGDVVRVKGNNPEGFSKSSSNSSQFIIRGKISASGSVMSLIDGIGTTKVIPNQYCFLDLFYGCTGLTQAPELPATKLASNCYGGMFRGCTSLTKAPELPATQLASKCYSAMFSGCHSLSQAPELTATQLDDGCYSFMFTGCTSLDKAPKLPATQLASLCYHFMFSGCKSLIQAPELPATQLAYGCYGSMFFNCSSLNYIKVGFTDWDSASDATKSWVFGVSKTGTFKCPKELALEYDSSRIPYDDRSPWGIITY